MPRSSTAHFFWLILLSSALPVAARGQVLPRGATPRGVVVAFLRETSSADSTIDRSAFRLRLAGELAAVDPDIYAGSVPRGLRVRVDSIPDVPPSEDDEDEGIERKAVAYVTLTADRETENLYLFLRRDSLWKLEAIRHLPQSSARPKIRAAMRTLDTSIPSNRLRAADLQRLLLSDDSLAGLLRSNLPMVEKVAKPLRGSRRWVTMSLRDFDFANLDEYRELDDDVPAAELVFYTIDRPALEQVKHILGIRRITRDRRHPTRLYLEAAAIDRGHYGYLHLGENAPLPTPSPEDFIMLKPVAGNWWLYKRLQ